MFKKAFILFSSILLLTFSLQAQLSVRVAFDPDTTRGVTVGDTFALGVTVDENARDLHTVSVTIGFGANWLDADSVRLGPLLSGPGSFNYAEPSPSSVRVDFQFGYQLSADGPGELFSVIFHAFSVAGGSELTFGNVVLTDVHGNILSHTAVPGWVTAISQVDTFPPAEVTNFQALPGNRTITLAWENPSDRDFYGVLIRRKTGGYPLSPTNGDSVYNGIGSWYDDIGLENRKEYFYKAFTYDDSTNYSSGIGISARPEGEESYAYPNPFNPEQDGEMGITFFVSQPTEVTVKIYSPFGRLVAVLLKDNPRSPGRQHGVSWDGKSDRGETVPNGVYYCFVETAEGDQNIIKLAVLR